MLIFMNFISRSLIVDMFNQIRIGIKSCPKIDYVTHSDLLHTFSRFLCWATNELNSAENINSTRKQHGKRSEFHASVWACMAGCGIPLVKVPAFSLVMDMVKETMFRHQESIRLERTLWNVSCVREKLVYRKIEYHYNKRNTYLSIIEVKNASK